MFNPVLLTKPNFTQNTLTNKLKFSVEDYPIGSVIQSDGKIIVFGKFSNYGGVYSRDNLIRLNSDGTVDTQFCVNASDGSKFGATVSSVKVQSNGKILVGGNFLAYGGVSNRNRLIRLNQDGTLDSSFCAAASDSAQFSDKIRKIETYTHSNLGTIILIAGDFTNHGGVVGVNYIVALNDSGSKNTTITNNLTGSGGFNAPIHAITPYTYTEEGGLPYLTQFFIGGAFTAYKGVSSRKYIARFDQWGVYLGVQIDLGVSPGSVVYDINVGGGIDYVMVCGNLLNIGGVSNRNHLAYYNYYAGILGTYYFSLETSYTDSISGGGKFNAPVTVLVSGGIYGTLFVGGDFTNYNGIPGRSYFLSLNDPNYNQQIIDDSFLFGESFGRDGTDLYSGNGITTNLYETFVFVTMNRIRSYKGTPNRNGLLKIQTYPTTLDNAFCSNASDGPIIANNITNVLQDLNGGILLNGTMINYKNVTGRSYLIKLNSNGAVNQEFCSNAVDNKFNSNVNKVVQQNDGKYLVCGAFTNYSGSGRNYLVRLNSNGTLDTTFDTVSGSGKFNGVINDIYYDNSDGSIYIAGNFTNYPSGTPGITYSRLIKVTDNGILDTTFCNNASLGSKFGSNIRSIYIQKGIVPSADKIVVGGDFINYGFVGSGRNYLVRLYVDGSLDGPFSANVANKLNSQVYSIKGYSSGDLIVVGNFTYNNPPNPSVAKIIKLDYMGLVDSTFANNVGSKFNDLCRNVDIKDNGNIVVGGDFSYYPNYPVLTDPKWKLVELNSDGTFYQGFNEFTDPSINGRINTVKVFNNNLAICGYESATPYGGFTLLDRVKNII